MALMRGGVPPPAHELAMTAWTTAEGKVRISAKGLPENPKANESASSSSAERMTPITGSDETATARFCPLAGELTGEVTLKCLEIDGLEAVSKTVIRR
jgi:hypothetical protein